jgi:two-component system response regulator TctD
MKALIIEDSLELANSLVNFFKIDGHVTDHAEDLETAEEHISVSKFDIVLLDIMLPDGDGRDFLKKIRKKNNNVPVIVMTAKTEISDKVDLLDIGADDYIIKPFDKSELEARCRAVLRRQSGQNQIKLEFANTIVYPLIAKIEVNGQTKTLRNRELRLLEIFYNSPEIIFSKDQLSDRMFSISEIVSENAIEVYIARIRKKLEGGDAKIETARGIGYKLTK